MVTQDGYKQVKIIDSHELILAYCGDYLCFLSMQPKNENVIFVKNLTTQAESKIELETNYDIVELITFINLEASMPINFIKASQKSTIDE